VKDLLQLAASDVSAGGSRALATGQTARKRSNVLLGSKQKIGNVLT
jgi:hypothetical protein